MRYLLSFISLFYVLITSAQHIGIKENKGVSIFEKHRENTVFLNSKSKEIDSIVTHFYTSEKYSIFSPKDSADLLHYAKLLRYSFQSFTDFNLKHLIAIDAGLSGNKPIQGSDINYLHHAFQVYKKYETTYERLLDKLEALQKESSHTVLKHLMLNIELDQFHFFYSNYYNAIRNKRLRRILNASDASFEIKDNDLRKIVKELLSKKNYNRIKTGILSNTATKASLEQIDSALYNQIHHTSYKKSRIRKDKRKMRRFFRQDNSYKFKQFLTHYISAVIGNAAGAVRLRKGFLYKNDSIRNLIQDKLRPMDILAEKTGFALTDKMIPGNFGHIALWLGTETQLKEAGLWDDPVIFPFQNRIRKGYCILESARDGTHLKRMKKFINVDELAIARIKDYAGLSNSEKIELYKNALSQLGKDYDFNFDVETSDKLVCSELLYQVFGSIYWPTDKFLKRSTISPDNVMSLSLYQNNPIELIYYIEGLTKTKFCEKSRDDLAQDLGFEKRNNVYVLPDERCETIAVKNGTTEKCVKVYHELLYKE
jgi:hypothetical protein